MDTATVTAAQVLAAVKANAVQRIERIQAAGFGPEDRADAIVRALGRVEVWAEGPREVRAYVPFARGVLPGSLAADVLDVDLGEPFNSTAHITQVDPSGTVQRITW